jgi:nitrile hydratase accessory protein
MTKTEPERPFTEPWQAHAFALVLQLHERGVFSWAQWTQALVAEIHRPGAGDGYYDHWLAALENVLGQLGVASPELLSSWRQAWDHVAHTTPHGHPLMSPAAGPTGEPLARPDY